jgi:hypothetical protein
VFLCCCVSDGLGLRWTHGTAPPPAASSLLLLPSLIYKLHPSFHLTSRLELLHWCQPVQSLLLPLSLFLGEVDPILSTHIHSKLVSSIQSHALKQERSRIGETIDWTLCRHRTVERWASEGKWEVGGVDRRWQGEAVDD